MCPGGRPIRAGEGNRTLTASLEGWSSTIELHPRHNEHCKYAVGLVGFEPTTSTSQTSRANQAALQPDFYKGNSSPVLVPLRRYVRVMEVGAGLQETIARWETLSRWERSELGKDLRRLGLSYGEVMGLIPVKKSTLATVPGGGAHA